jgi:hypothetical protein
MIPNQRLKTAINHLAGATLTVALLLLLSAGAWLFWPSRGFTSVDIRFVDPSGHVTDTKPVVSPGEDVAYSVSYCIDEKTPIPVTVRRAIELQNHVFTYGLSEIGYQISKPCESVIRILTVPPMVRPGEYRIKVYTDIQGSPIRRIYQAWESPTFTVLPK